MTTREAWEAIACFTCPYTVKVSSDVAYRVSVDVDYASVVLNLYSDFIIDILYD